MYVCLGGYLFKNADYEVHLRLLESVVLRDGVQVSGLLASLPGDVYAHISLIISYLDPLQALLFA